MIESHSRSNLLQHRYNQPNRLSLLNPRNLLPIQTPTLIQIRIPILKRLLILRLRQIPILTQILIRVPQLLRVQTPIQIHRRLPIPTHKPRLKLQQLLLSQNPTTAFTQAVPHARREQVLMGNKDAHLSLKLAHQHLNIVLFQAVLLVSKGISMARISSARLIEILVPIIVCSILVHKIRWFSIRLPDLNFAALLHL